MACQAWYCQYFVFVHNQSICLLWFKLLKGSWAFFEIIGKPHSVAGLGMCLLGLGIFTCVPFGPFTTSMMLPCDSPASRPTQCKVGSSKYSGRCNIDHITHWVLFDLKKIHNWHRLTQCAQMFSMNEEKELYYLDKYMIMVPFGVKMPTEPTLTCKGALPFTPVLNFPSFLCVWVS